MEKYPVYRGELICGNVGAEREGLYTRFSARFDGAKGTLYSLLLEGERGTVLLGVPEWRDGSYVLRRTLANRTWEQIGTVDCARLTERGAAGEKRAAEQDWMRLEHPEYFFHRLMPQLASGGTCYWKPTKAGRYLAVPMEKNRPFLLPRYFCFAKVEQLWGRTFAVFFFDADEYPCID